MAEVGSARAVQIFADQLRAWREQRGWTQERAAREFGCSSQLVSLVETLNQRPTEKFAAMCDKAFGTPGTFAAFQALAAAQALPAYFADVIPYEKQATAIHGWELGPVPGLLQTADYARAQIKSVRYDAAPEEIGRIVDVRLERQGILAGETKPVLWYVLDERVLRHAVGGTTVMGSQLDRLLEVTETPGCMIQVLPFTADNHAGSDGPISVYEFASEPTVCYTECSGGGRVVEDRKEVMRLTTLISLLRASALPIGQSRDVIREIRSAL